MASPSQSKVCLFFDGVRFYLPNRTALKEFAIFIARREGAKLGELNIIFCNDTRLLEINRSFLKHDYYTDIITFDLTPRGSKAIEAEIYISVERVKENAVQQGTSFQSEIHRVIFHGILHLCGYKDKTASDKSTMREKEAEYLRRYL